MQKVCSKCGLEHPYELFSNVKHTKDGKQSYCKPCGNAAARERRKTAQGQRAYRNTDMKRRYGIDIEGLEALAVAQDFKCAICEDPVDIDNSQYVIDHNHTTGEVRGILCRPCNGAIGLLKDNPKITASATKYLLERGHYG